MTTSPTLRQWETAKLQPHPINDEIYGDHADGDLIASVREKGVLNPLLVTNGGLVVSGHRRLDAAKRAGIASVPVVVFGSADELDVIEALIASNKQRDHTPEQKAREFKHLKAVEEERAKRRQLVGLKNQPVVQGNFPERGQARDVAAEKIGVSGRTAERAVKVVDAIDTLKAAGKVREAEQLRQTLNSKSVSRAFDQAKDAGYIAPTPQPEQQTKQALYYTLDEWRAEHPDARLTLLDDGIAGNLTRTRTKMNFQEENNIEWALWSWNPVTGCLHNCSYCYARDIAERFYPQKFVPSFHLDRLAAPANTTVPLEAATQIGYKNVFTCSMADLFGRWVPTQWIEAVLEVVRSNPQWNFLFLTKFPGRLSEFEFPDNAWVGGSVDAQARVPLVEKAFAKVNAKVKWLSCEPLLEPLHFSRLDLFQWVVIGGASKSTQTPEYRPARAWSDALLRQAKDAGCKVYEKTNLYERIREYPGLQAAPQINIPEAFKMGYLQRDIKDWQTYAKEITVA